VCEGLIGRKNIKRKFPNAHLILERKKNNNNRASKFLNTPLIEVTSFIPE